MSTTNELISRACYAQMKADNHGHILDSALFYGLATRLYELQKKVDELEKDSTQVRTKALEEAICIVNENRMNSNGATMTIDSLRGLFNDTTD